MKNLTTFKISDTQYLKINPENINLNECTTCANIDIDYVDEGKNICIRFGYEDLSNFCYFIAEYGYIQKLINNSITLDPIIVANLGFEWNQFFKDNKNKTAASKYLFLTNDHKQIRPYFSSWLYNDKDGNVIFEITPFYPWHGETKKLNPDFIPYKQFMKDYKPAIKTIIPKKNLKQWIKQAETLDKIIHSEDKLC